MRDLFFNVPARKKFLRSDQTELAHIASLVTHYSLAHKEKTFLLVSEEKELLNVTPAATLRDRVYQVFGGDTLAESSTWACASGPSISLPRNPERRRCRRPSG